VSAGRLHERITDHFAGRSERADIWRAFALFLDTERFLNLGYSAWYQPHVVGSSQRRLATELGRTLSEHLPRTAGVRLLDIGCGRGGPSVHLAGRFGFRVVGVDLVPYNVARARDNAADAGADAAFAVGDAANLPIAPESVAACTAVDSLVYLPDRPAVFAELAAALEPGGVLVFSDLVARPDATNARQRAVARFAEAWGMPPLGSAPAYEGALADAGFAVRTVEDITPHSVGRFRKWTALFRRVHDGPAGPLIDRLLERRGLNAGTITEQIERAHEALPALQHVRFVVEKRPRSSPGRR